MKRLILALAVIAALFCCGAAFAEEHLTEFSAVFSATTSEGTTTGKIYVVKDKMRYEEDGSGEIVVSRYDKKVTWFIYPKLKAYAEESNSGAQNLDPEPPQEGTFGDLTRKSAGYEDIDSYHMKKYLVTIKLPGKTEPKDEYYEWYRDYFPFPVKTQTTNGSYTYELSKIKTTQMDPDLFREPKGYKKMSMEDIDALSQNSSDKAKKKK